MGLERARVGQGSGSGRKAAVWGRPRQLAQQHPYMRLVIQGFLDNLAQQRGCARIEGVVFSV